MISLKPYTLVGFEPRSSVPEAVAVPWRQGLLKSLEFQNVGESTNLESTNFVASAPTKFQKSFAPKMGVFILPFSLHTSRVTRAGLPHGFFSNQKSQFWYIMEGFRLENVKNILWPFGIFYRHSGYCMA
jgi:hypothetical protein